MAQITKAQRSARLRWARVREERLRAAGQAEQVQQLSPAAPPLRRKRTHQAPVPAGPGVYLGTRSRAGAAAAVHVGGVVPPPAPSPSPPPPPPPPAASPSPPPPPTPASSPSSSSSPSPPPPMFRVLPKMEEPLAIKEEPLLVKLEDADIKQELIKEEPEQDDGQQDNRTTDNRMTDNRTTGLAETAEGPVTSAKNASATTNANANTTTTGRTAKRRRMSTDSVSEPPSSAVSYSSYGGDSFTTGPATTSAAACSSDSQVVEVIGPWAGVTHCEALEDEFGILLTQLHGVGVSEGGSGVEEGSGAERSAENRRKMKFLGLSFGLEAEAEAASEEPWVVPEAAASPLLHLRPSLNSALGLMSGLLGGRPTFLHIAAPKKGATPNYVEEGFPP
ncbi:hypothetical protein DFH29DRAFT_1043925 [Suillus ampliporus]|nr:hypothetical protein DFH29DRAFT_1043925 [Suillus ampliporus]